ncbi:MAG: PRC-barrel domain-containing protein [Peptococcaceae bacterium]|jgi:uncharacterized protein YrrD|nr:PRC-barrel domain-containing protein [Peptococcaceae bacterium]MDH7525143.1 PRC-barrel domain-containing protein [Peptococcaceae bacterium]
MKKELEKMRKGREFRNKPVIDVSSGKLLGYVVGFKPGEDRRLEGLFLISPRREPFYLPFQSVSSVGRDSVMVKIRPGDLTMEAGQEWEGQFYRGLAVVTLSGENLGIIEDIVLGEEQGMIAGFEVSDGLLKDLVAGRRIIPAENVLKFGDDAVIITDTQ